MCVAYVTLSFAILESEVILVFVHSTGLTGHRTLASALHCQLTENARTRCVNMAGWKLEITQR